MYAGTIAKVEWRLKFPFANGEFRVDIGIKPDVFSINFYDRVFCASTLTVHPTIDLIGKNFGGYFFVNSEIDIKVYESKLATVQADKFL
jgi:lipopolysaccharide transport system ATP-binding protein